jgi:hypothetical protein
MALGWVRDHHEMVQGKSLMMGPFKCDWYAQEDDREYLVPRNDPKNQVRELGIRVAAKLKFGGEFSSLEAAKQYAEEWEAEQEQADS